MDFDKLMQNAQEQYKKMEEEILTSAKQSMTKAGFKWSERLHQKTNR